MQLRLLSGSFTRQKHYPGWHLQEELNKQAIYQKWKRQLAGHLDLNFLEESRVLPHGTFQSKGSQRGVVEGQGRD